ncbi:MAG: DUF190 domain-containing protein [Candidatus Marinimicrobia bacterium]|nr:DUF190 domain-containing protein [Candidatus Neomarinimicrobiota bacterium]
MLEHYAGQKLCIFISKNDKYEGIILYELLLEIAFNSRLSGGTVTIGDKGFFGAQDESTKLKILRSSENLPVVLEFQGRTNRISRYIERIEPLIKEGLITLTDVQITKFNATDEDADDFEGQKNEDQSKIFDENNNVSSRPESQQEDADETLDVDERDSVTSDSEEQAEATSQPEDDKPVSSEFLEPDEVQNIEEDIVDIPEPHIETPSFDDDDVAHSAHELETDQEEMPEDGEIESSDPPFQTDSFSEEERDDESTPPAFQSLDDDQIQDEPVENESEVESDSSIDEEDEEDAPALQLADLSETKAEEDGGDSSEMEFPDKTEEDTSDKSEFTESQTEDEFDELFDESNEKFESNFNHMLKQAGEASVDDADLDSGDEKTTQKEDGETAHDEASESAGENSKSDDNNSKEEDMKNYFSKLFKK